MVTHINHKSESFNPGIPQMKKGKCPEETGKNCERPAHGAMAMMNKKMPKDMEDMS